MLWGTRSRHILHSRGKNHTFLHRVKIPDRKADLWLPPLSRRFLCFQYHLRRGSEFAGWQTIEKKALNCDVYFADLYCAGKKALMRTVTVCFESFIPKGEIFPVCPRKHFAESDVNEHKTLQSLKLSFCSGFVEPRIQPFVALHVTIHQKENGCWLQRV